MANIVVLTGAGISAESGISTFRDADGLWEAHRIEDVASPVAFRRNPELVHQFYNLRRAQLHEVQPNKAHEALSEFERAWRGRFLLITQNIDDLHERAGSRKVLHMHGEIRKLRCGICGDTKYHEQDAGTALICRNCGKHGHMRPDIVWFGEVPYRMEDCESALAKADIFVAIGTSGQVYPAASFAGKAQGNGRGCLTIEINLNPTGNAGFSRSIREPATTGVPRLINELLCQRKD